MRANRVSAYVFAVAASLAGCAGGGSGHIGYSSNYSGQYAGQVVVTSPELIEIEPGVQVFADAEEPLFYSDGSYWLYRDGYWMRSNDYRGGFVQVQLSYVPQRVRVIERPQTYVQYKRHHQRDYEARRQEQQRRSRPDARTNVYRANETTAPNRDMDVDRRDDRANRPDLDRPAANPMPPRGAGASIEEENRDDRGDRDRGDERGDRDRRDERGDRAPVQPPGQARRPGPQPTAPASEPAREDRGNDRDRTDRNVKYDEHGNSANAPGHDKRDKDDHGNGNGNGNGNGKKKH